MLDDRITQNEVALAAEKLKDKNSSSDGLCAPLVRNVLHIVMPLLVLLCNCIFFSAMYPAKWSISVIHALHKKLLMSDSNNYRGISLVELLAKLYDVILCERLKRWFIPHMEQSGFQEGRSCAEHVFMFTNFDSCCNIE